MDATPTLHWVTREEMVREHKDTGMYFLQLKWSVPMYAKRSKKVPFNTYHSPTSDNNLYSSKSHALQDLPLFIIWFATQTAKERSDHPWLKTSFRCCKTSIPIACEKIAGYCFSCKSSACIRVLIILLTYLGLCQLHSKRTRIQ